MIPEPQRTYLLELLNALGPAAQDFVIAGAQAMKFAVEKARGTKDFDFLLNVVAWRKEPLQLAQMFERLGYTPVPESRNFQFEKSIPGSAEKMRIEFMAPEEYKREKDFRVDIQNGVHARACTGGSIALAQSDLHPIFGKLPNGDDFTAEILVAQPHALVMLKLLALADRYSNIRGPKEARHDREEAQTHAADIVAIVTAVPDISRFNNLFVALLHNFCRNPFLVFACCEFFRTSFARSHRRASSSTRNTWLPTCPQIGRSLNLWLERPNWRNALSARFSRRRNSSPWRSQWTTALR